ncbi:MAG: hypothetical protein HC894_13740 [Microcoleus sp. SM1_3_4]|nr:hypothetical protein [Microcoleus sp. SM1_3_4]
MCINDEIDAELKQLAVAAKNFPPKTLQRQQALTELMKKIQAYRTVHLPKNDNFSRETYEEICVEAQQDFWLRICREIHNYRPDREVRQWANFLLKKCFQEAAGKVIGNVPIENWVFPQTSDKHQILVPIILKSTSRFCVSKIWNSCKDGAIELEEMAAMTVMKPQKLSGRRSNKIRAMFLKRNNEKIPPR